MNIIKFKTDSDKYPSELEDIKNNTIRFTDDWDIKRWGKVQLATHIKIINAGDQRQYFVRKIRHKCTYKNLAIITWEPEKK